MQKIITDKTQLVSMNVISQMVCDPANGTVLEDFEIHQKSNPAVNIIYP